MTFPFGPGFPPAPVTPFYGMLNGVPGPGRISGVGAVYPPHWSFIDAIVTAMSTTSTRLYYIPYYVDQIFQFTGIKTRNQSAAQAGNTYRCGIYAINTTTFLPGALLQDCGEVTLTGAVAERTLASSFTPTYIGWHFLAIHANQVSSMAKSASSVNAATSGGYDGINMGYVFGIPALNGSYASFGAYYVDTAYGALASTAVAPTGIVIEAPSIAPYRT